MARTTSSSLIESASSYQEALRLLASRRRPSRPARSINDEPSSLPRQYATPDLRGIPSIVGMRKWLHVLGHSDADLRALNVIHVAGTKGKGSTCAFTEAFLRCHGKRTGYPRKTGLYTSPHLVLPQERIRINFSPLSEDKFAKYFFEVYRTLEHTKELSDNAPRYLQFWALIAFHAFIREKVDVAIVETHHGGEFDATNFIAQPLVTVVTTLGMDHVQQLGPTLSNIAWHKAGIFKPGATAITAPQDMEAAAVLRERAAEKDVELVLVSVDTAVSGQMSNLPSEVLRLNCSVALSASNAYLRKLNTGEHLVPDDITAGIASFAWPGRFQQLQAGEHQWCLDAAHNEFSMEKAAQWFAEVAARDVSSSRSNLLMFSHISSHRDGANVLRRLLSCLRSHHVPFNGVIFTTYVRTEAEAHCDQDINAQADEEISSLWETYSKIWSEHYPDTNVYLQPTIDGAVHLVQRFEHCRCRILATGSQHLLGGILQLLPTDHR